MDNSDTPITVSEIPPKKQSGGLSYFYKIGERSTSGISERSSKSEEGNKADSSLTFTNLRQTRIDNWCDISHSKLMLDAEDKIPPWVSTGKSTKRDDSFSLSTAPYPIQEEGAEEDKNYSINDAASECSLPSINDLPINKPGSKKSGTADKGILNSEEYSIMAEEISILSEEELYETPLAGSSPEENLPDRLSLFHDINTEDTALYDLEEVTQPYNYNDITEATQPYNFNDIIEATQPYDHYGSSQETVPYSSTSQETQPYDPYADSQSEGQYSVHDSLPAFTNEDQQYMDTPKIAPDPFKVENTDIPFTLSQSPINEEVSPIADLTTDMGSTLTPPEIIEINPEHCYELEKNTLTYEGKRQHDQFNLFNPLDDKEEQKVQSPLKIQKLSQETAQNEKNTSSTSTSSSSEVIKLVRPEKKQIRNSTLKKPMTIENYFLFPSEASLQGEEEQDIGKDSATPSSFNYEDVKKDSTQAISSSIGQRRRPRFGLSKKTQK